MTTRARTMTEVLVLLAVIGSLIGVVAAPAAASTTLPSPPDYVALGDSYSSGLGAPPFNLDAACRRSSQSYPALWAAEHHPASFGFAACSGAMTTDVLVHQIPALQPGTDLVTITVGGNDAGFAPVLQTCTVAASDQTCITAVNIAEIFVLFALPALLSRTYAAVRHAAPHAQVIVLGYPRLFELTPTCTDPLAPDLARRTKLNQGADLLNAVIQAVSNRFGFSFVDVRDRFAGHGVCSTDPTSSWINGPATPPDVGPYHPTATGYRDGYLPALDAATAAVT
jgi:lysophospholipase L1-like esterase